MNGDTTTKRERGPRNPLEKNDRPAYGQTPRDRDKACDNCGVEKALYRGTDPLTNVLRYVGDRCLYTIKRGGDLQVLP